MISDSSSLIIFAKINKFDLVTSLYEKLDITYSVHKESIEKGIKKGLPDAKILRSLVENKKIEVVALDKKHKKISENLRETYNLGAGESETIALALQKNEKVILMDEKLGRSVSRFYNIRPLGSLRVVLECFKKEIISEEKVRNIIEKIVENDFRVGADVVNEFWKVFEKIKTNNNL